MGFVFPLVLIGLLALAIPVIIHLFYFRRYKKVYFTNVRFLRELQEQKSHTDRLRKLLVLAARLAALALIVFAFAQPFLGRKKAHAGRNNVAIYIDNSFSMGLTDGSIALLDDAKARAREIADAYGPEDRFLLLTNEFEGKHQRWSGKEDVLGMIDEIELSPFSRNISEVQRRQSALYQNAGSGNREAYILSDFQKHIAGNSPDTSYFSNLIHLKGKAEKNLYVDTVWLRDPVQWLNASNQLIVRVKNAGTRQADKIRLTFQLNGKVKSIADVTVPPQGDATDTLNFTVTEPGWQNGVVSFNDYPITFDDKFYLSFRVNQSNRILSIEEGFGKPYISSIFSGDNYFAFDRREKNALDYSTFKDYQLIVLNEPSTISQGFSTELANYLNSGGSVYLIPASNADLNSYNSFLGSVQAGRLEAAQERPLEVSSLNTQENIFKAVFNELPRNMDLPKVSKMYSIVSGYGATEVPLMRLNNGRSFISAFKVGSGLLYLQSVPLDPQWSNLPSHAIFPPMVYNFGIFRSSSQPLYFTIGSDNFLEAENPPGTRDAVMKMSNGSIEFIPPLRPVANKVILSMPRNLNEAGIYTLRSDEKVILTAAFNNPSKESELEFLSRNEVEKKYNSDHQDVMDDTASGLQAEVRHIRKGTVMWKICLIFALAFLMLETIFLRYWPAKSA